MRPNRRGKEMLPAHFWECGAHLVTCVHQVARCGYDSRQRYASRPDSRQGYGSLRHKQPRRSLQIEPNQGDAAAKLCFQARQS